MQIDGVNQHQGQGYGLGRLWPRGQEAEEVENEQVVTSEAAEAADEGSSDEEDVKGVIRLLQEGHFRGVSDVRLRINFFDELAAIEAGGLKAAAEEGINGILEAVSSGVGCLPKQSEDAEGGGEGISELQGQFAQLVSETYEEFAAAEAPSADALISGVSTAFAAFIEGLWSLYEPIEEPVEEEGATGAGDGEEVAAVKAEGEENAEGLEATTAASEGDWQSYIEGLESSFAAAMEELVTSLNGVQVLPALSEPNGNGVAYDKFLAIYNEMLGAGTAETVLSAEL
jgi:hypothetical protein